VYVDSLFYYALPVLGEDYFKVRKRFRRGRRRPRGIRWQHLAHRGAACIESVSKDVQMSGENNSREEDYKEDSYGQQDSLIQSRETFSSR
jgi:hypothetical protein